MTKLTHIGCAAVMLCASGSAWAGGETGLYVGGSTGSASADVSYTDSGAGAVSFDGDDTAYKVFLGYNFGMIPLINLAVEASYFDFGTATGTVSSNNAEMKADGVAAFGLAGFNLGPVSLFAKAGAINWDSEATVQSNKVEQSGTDPAYGIGAQIQLWGIGLRAEYELFDFDSVDIDFASVGVSFTF